MGMYNNGKAKAEKNLTVEVVPDSIIADASTAPQKVGKGNLCRIVGTAGGFVRFGTEAALTGVPGVASATSKETMITEAKVFIVAASDEFIRTSAAMRIEVIKD